GRFQTTRFPATEPHEKGPLRLNVGNGTARGLFACVPELGNAGAAFYRTSAQRAIWPAPGESVVTHTSSTRSDPDSPRDWPGNSRKTVPPPPRSPRPSPPRTATP